MKMKYTLLALAAMAGAANAASIALNFAENTNQQFTGGENIGPTGIDSSNWNNTANGVTTGNFATGTLNGLIDDTGAATGVNASWSSNNGFFNGDGTATDEAKLAVGYLDDSAGVTVTITGITYSTYSAYVLFTSDQNGDYQHGEITVEGVAVLGGGDFNAHGRVTDGTGWVEADGTVFGNYIKIDGLTDSQLDITSIRNGAARGPITGVIVVDAVPEPSSTALLGLGGLALILRRRK